MNTISNGELSDPLCDSVNRGLTLVRLIYYQCSIFIYFNLDYAVVLMEEVNRVRLEFGSYRESRQNREAAVQNSPAPIADSYEHVPKTELVQRPICRLNEKC